MTRKAPFPMFKEVDPGNVRVYYKKGNSLVCFQEGTNQKRFDYYACSKDGEPSHLLSVNESLLKWIQQPPDFRLPLVSRFWEFIQNERIAINAQSFKT